MIDEPLPRRRVPVKAGYFTVPVDRPASHRYWETTLQLRGEAGRRQVKDGRPRNGLCHMMGGG